jgi:hypothetical protein
MADEMCNDLIQRINETTAFQYVSVEEEASGREELKIAVQLTVRSAIVFVYFPVPYRRCKCAAL